jgi:uncharacterized protein with HEPN domain
MGRGDREWCGDILNAIADIRHDTAGMDLSRFEASPVVVCSMLYSIGLIGEATKHLSNEFKTARPTVPWRAIAGMRDRVVHEYFRTSVSRIWDVVTDDLDPLEASLRGTLSRTDNSTGTSS